jgi:hypothetical protein
MQCGGEEGTRKAGGKVRTSIYASVHISSKKYTSVAQGWWLVGRDIFLFCCF